MFEALWEGKDIPKLEKIKHEKAAALCKSTETAKKRISQHAAKSFLFYLTGELTKFNKNFSKSNHIECTHHSNLLKITKYFLTIDSDLVDKADSEYLEELDFRQIITKTAKLLAEMNLRLAREDCKGTDNFELLVNESKIQEILIKLQQKESRRIEKLMQ
ncbi:Oidioi.mRNA.OKI2018_I69.PAR.g12902.t1.cds [Oikopleura dioica]|uniref:Oidioi.mRNA.OKI2018_I69.PAR.g12902.t1.cds n=1 Tax=Oikopleura dioica TaxID=34765 RepID=A0ABN7S287_OIKDI|nr:Oidioi.mRNA.OKI2018_I69.PAR.g12902.t1.cds [Oikopleura dioica]